MRNRISKEVDFCNTSHTKCMLSNPRHPNLDPTTSRKSNLEIDMKKKLFLFSKNTQKALRMGPQNQQKIDKIQAWTSQGPSLCPPMSQDRPRVVTESPRTPKWRHQACQMTPMGTKIHKKSVKIQAWTSKVSFVVFPSVPKSAQGPQVRQIEATNRAK